MGYKLIKVNPKYQFVYENAAQRYQKKYPKYTEEHIHNMAKRIVIRKFLKNLYLFHNSFCFSFNFIEEFLLIGFPFNKTLNFIASSKYLFLF